MNNPENQNLFLKKAWQYKGMNFLKDAHRTYSYIHIHQAGRTSTLTDSNQIHSRTAHNETSIMSGFYDEIEKNIVTTAQKQ